MKVKLAIETSAWRYEEKEIELDEEVATVLLNAFQEKNWARAAFAKNPVGSTVTAFDRSSYKKYSFTLTEDLYKAFTAGEYSLGIGFTNAQRLQDALKLVADKRESLKLNAEKPYKPESYLDYFNSIQEFVNGLSGNQEKQNKALRNISIASNRHATFAEEKAPESKISDHLQPVQTPKRNL